MANARSYQLSAIEVKALTGWPDAIVDDYITNFSNILALSEDISTNSDNIEINKSNITTLTADKADKFPPSAVGNIAILDASGNLADSLTNVTGVTMKVGTGNPNGSVTSNYSRQFFDTAAGDLYCNPAIGVNTGWVIV